MAIDTTLISRFMEQQPQRPSLLDSATKAAQLRNVGMQNRASEVNLRQAERGERNAMAIEKAFTLGDPKRIRQALVEAGAGDAVMKIDQFIATQSNVDLDRQIKQAELAIKQAEAENDPRKYLLQYLKGMAEVHQTQVETDETLATGRRADATEGRAKEEFGAKRDIGFASGDLADARRLLGPNINEAQFHDYLRRKNEAGQTSKLLTPEEEAQAVKLRTVGRASEPLVAITRNGKSVLVPRSEAAGQEPANNRERIATGQERTSLGFFNRAKEALETITELEPEIQKLNLGGQARMEMAPNFLQSQLGQSYRQAQRQFTEARLRKESGAVINESEYARDSKTYFAVPGDTTTTLEQKRRARNAVLESIKITSGRAYGEYYGEGGPAGRDGGEIAVISPDGQEGSIPAEDWPAAEAEGYRRK